MATQKLQIKTAIQILKPAQQVFEAIVDPAKMSNYFISESSGPMEAGKTVTWKFPEFAETFPVRVSNVEPDKSLSFFWDGTDGTELQVEIALAPTGNQATVVTITEKEMDNNEAGLTWLMGNTAGWANFLACLKAYLEHGINLRKGAFDFMKPGV
ncbi:SRPBCC domain-containing protein [Pontibacter populi]|uniref:SRPBCC domain-containing protein n=1 Tax=Pontibacter populi TaxID=890055 RepID=A0ABV1RUB8_9BACT